MPHWHSAGTDTATLILIMVMDILTIHIMDGIKEKRALFPFGNRAQVFVSPGNGKYNLVKIAPLTNTTAIAP